MSHTDAEISEKVSEQVTGGARRHDQGCCPLGLGEQPTGEQLKEENGKNRVGEGYGSAAEPGQKGPRTETSE